MTKAEIIKVQKDSIAEELDIEKGDFLVRIDGKDIYDIIQYEHMIYKEFIIVEILKKDINEIWEFEIEKDEFEDLGIEFKSPVFDGVRTCKNNCVFCFVAQLPKGLRKTLYLKDEDFRLSFLYGSYTTFSNLTDDDIKRIIKEHISPLYVSVHATDSMVRKVLLRNRDAGNILEKIKYLTDNGIELHTQAVIVPGYNDGKILEKTIDDLASFYPQVKSLTVVPVGLTKYHKGGLRLNTEEESKKIVKYTLEKSKEFKEKFDTYFSFLSDEFFIQSKMDIPEKEYYEEFEHIENGVGLVRLLLEEVKDMKIKDKFYKGNKITIACGKSIYKYMKEIFIHDDKINIVPIESYFWGEKITVTGLITGSDLIKNLKDKELGDKLIINKIMLNDKKQFLDDMSLEGVSERIGTKIKVIERLEEIYD
ncbi:DUF512 domain-containing protein [Haliovirga abyssi]|uniref:Radical SAM protein n=1 Tax=Haliovirga abyssi TaxID=2996794 RepID=A0AAU9DCG4_9FUSO|nr:DUF512 domain-containing protein [Haliovirga abyssi]BDU49838.1 radical SAM protein [Haliovirga abyssi]